MTNETRELVAILISIPAGDQGIRRLRALLKCMLRSYGIRCIRITRTSDERSRDHTTDHRVTSDASP